MKKIGIGNKLYIAYGSNLNLGQMERRCPYAVPIGPAELSGYQLLFRGGNGCSVATVEPQEGSSVPVLLWEITPRCEEALDHYEGWPRLYRKERVTVSVDGKPVEAMVYIMNSGQLGTPGESYYNSIAVGYETAGFDVAVLEEAVSVSKNLAKAEKHGYCLRCSSSINMEDQFEHGADRLFCEVKQEYVGDNDSCKEFN